MRNLEWWGMENLEWEMENGKCRIGEWEKAMENGEWRISN